MPRGHKGEKRPKQPAPEEMKAKALDRWGDEGGASATKTPKRPRDLNQWAKRMVDIATGEPEAEDNAKEGVRGRKGGLKGGGARATALDPEKRREIAQKAAGARWAKKQP